MKCETQLQCRYDVSQADVTNTNTYNNDNV